MVIVRRTADQVSSKKNDDKGVEQRVCRLAPCVHIVF